LNGPFSKTSDFVYNVEVSIPLASMILYKQLSIYHPVHNPSFGILIKNIANQRHNIKSAYM